MKRTAIDTVRARYKNARNLLEGIYHRLDPRPKLAVFLYHRVLPEPNHNPFGMVVTSKTFEKHLDVIVKKYKVVSLDAAASESANGNRAVLTFDDGFIDNYEIAFPILKRKGLPAAFFVNTDYVNTGTVPWYWAMSKHGVKRSLFDHMKAEGKFLENIDNDRDDTCITWAQARTMAHGGMNIGSHAASHRSLTRIPFEEAVDEIKKSKAVIEKNINISCDYFSFPFGGPNDYNQPLIDCVKQSGYKACLLNIRGYDHFIGDMPVFKRIIMDEHINLSCLP